LPYLSVVVVVGVAKMGTNNPQYQESQQKKWINFPQTNQMAEMQGLASRLIVLRKAKGLTQDELAQRLGMTKSGVSKFENGKSNPLPENLLKISEILGVSIEYLLTGESDSQEGQGFDAGAPETQDPINERINFLINHYEQGVRRRFSLKIGVSAGMISDLFSERKNKPGLDMVRKILIAYPQISTEWLLLGEGEMLKTPPENAQAQKTSPYMQTIYGEGDGLATPPSPSALGIGSDLREGETVYHHGRPQPTYLSVSLKEKGKTVGVEKIRHTPASELPGMDLLKQVAAHTEQLKELSEAVAQLLALVPEGKRNDPAN
jgi:transcriptional regulator with XRE-family HTH domain